MVVAKKEVTSGEGGGEGTEEEKDGEKEERREEEARLFLAEVRCLRDLGSILLRILNNIYMNVKQYAILYGYINDYN